MTDCRAVGGGGGGRAGRKEKEAEAEEERKKKATNLEHQAETSLQAWTMWQSWSQSQSTPVISGRHGRQQARAWAPQAFMFPGVVKVTHQASPVANSQAPTGNHDQCSAVPPSNGDLRDRGGT